MTKKTDECHRCKFHKEEIERIKESYTELKKYFREACNDIKHAKRHVPDRWHKYLKDD